MAKEIELKLLLNASKITGIRERVHAFRIKKQDTVYLQNNYFDTPDRRLWQWGLGLRVRRNDRGLEQTIKTRGQVIGGLHQRGEYNCPLDEPWPTLALFPAELWPEGADLQLVQQHLKPLFCTDFKRELWQIEWQNGSEVEVALDQGLIERGEQQEPICELELELLCGKTDALFELAREIILLGGVRFGLASKAQRGFALAEGVRLQVRAESLPSGNAQQVLQAGLAYWLYHQELCLQGDQGALAQMNRAMTWMFRALSGEMVQGSDLERGLRMLQSQLLEHPKTQTSLSELLTSSQCTLALLAVMQRFE